MTNMSKGSHHLVKELFFHITEMAIKSQLNCAEQRVEQKNRNIARKKVCDNSDSYVEIIHKYDQRNWELAFIHLSKHPILNIFPN